MSISDSFDIKILTTKKERNISLQFICIETPGLVTELMCLNRIFSPSAGKRDFVFTVYFRETTVCVKFPNKRNFSFRFPYVIFLFENEIRGISKRCKILLWHSIRVNARFVDSKR